MSKSPNNKIIQLLTSIKKISIDKIVAGIIILLLLLIALPNFLDPARKYKGKKCARCFSDMRSLATALESYYIDHGSYPIDFPISKMKEFNQTYQKYGYSNINTTFPGSGKTAGLTTPTAYLTSLFVDHMNNLPFAYHTYQDRYLLYTTCLDEVFDITNPRIILEATTEKEIRLRLSPYTYDPTNGLGTPGDLWRIGGVGIETENQ